VSEFSPEWLDLREPADLRARSREVANAVGARFTLRDDVRVLDLGSGTAASLRATAPLLPKRQTWILAERDAALHEAAKARLAAWADASEFSGDAAHLRKDGTDIDIIFQAADLAIETPRLLDAPLDLVTASAFFDLASADYIRTFAKAVSARRIAFYASLTYNGQRRWTPHRPADNQMAAAFHRHQLRDKGLGLAAGPLAPAHLADQFRLNGYSVIEGDSDWRLERGDRMLIDELVRGHAVAVSETGGVEAKTIVNWINVPRTGVVVGHTDTFAAPAF
jgi:hypothetical protein